VQQSKELLRISDENMDMVFDFMQQIMSRLDSLEKKIDGNQQCFEKLSKKIEKRKVSVEYMFFHVKLYLLLVISSMAIAIHTQ